MPGMPREPTLSILLFRRGGVCWNGLGRDVREQDRFPDLELLETNDDSVYFDRRLIGGCPFASFAANLPGTGDGRQARARDGRTSQTRHLCATDETRCVMKPMTPAPFPASEFLVT